MRLLVTGDRFWGRHTLADGTWDVKQNDLDNLALNRELILVFADDLLRESGDVMITGGALGADTLAIQWAVRHQIPTNTFQADWKKYGKAAGPIRNEQMLRVGQPDRVLAFHANLGQSRGTRDMVERARKAGIPVKVVDK